MNRRPKAKISVSVHFVCAVLRHAREAGVDTQALLRRQRIPPRLLTEPLARISVQQFADLQTSTMQAMGDESLGYAQRRMPLGTWDMMCHAVINSRTLGQALHRYCRFFQIMGDGMSPQQIHAIMQKEAQKRARQTTNPGYIFTDEEITQKVESHHRGW